MARKPNRTGRDPSDHYTQLFRRTLETPAWAALSTTAQAIYPFLKLEWHGPKANNNGRIQLSVRQAAARVGVGINAAARGFHDLQAKGLIVVKTLGALGIEGEARGPSFEITELPLPGANRPVGRRLYENWRMGQDLPVAMHNVNNPNGKNGRKIPSSKQGRSYLQNGDVGQNPVTKLKTAHPQNSDVGGISARGTVIEMKTSLITIPRAKNMVPDLSVIAEIHLCPMLANRSVGMA